MCGRRGGSPSGELCCLPTPTLPARRCPVGPSEPGWRLRGRSPSGELCCLPTPMPPPRRRTPTCCGELRGGGDNAGSLGSASRAAVRGGWVLPTETAPGARGCGRQPADGKDDVTTSVLDASSPLQPSGPDPCTHWPPLQPGRPHSCTYCFVLLPGGWGELTWPTELEEVGPGVEAAARRLDL